MSPAEESEIFAAIDGTDVSRVANLADTEANATNAHGLTAFEYACLRNNLGAAEALLDAGASGEIRRSVIDELYARDFDGAYSPLDVALIGDSPEVALCLIESGARVDTHGVNGYSPLHWAAYFGLADVCAALVTRGAPLEARTDSGATPLFLAVVKGKVGAVAVLAAAGASTDVSTPGGGSLLSIAARKPRIRALLEATAGESPK
jgi:ankyrin repeat protein